MSISTPVAPVAGDIATRIAALRHRVDGDVLTPADPGYEQVLAAWSRTTAHSPAVVVLADNVGDVIAAVTFAAELGIGLAVQATSHGRVAPVDGVLLITARLQDVAVDPEERTAWVAAGCTWADIVAATQTHGLAPIADSSPSVGAVASTLGGGLGWLARHHGPACDAVRSFEVVTADGSLVRTCRDENGELFRALRGGGGSLGVITDMEIALVPMTTVYAGNLHYPAERAAEVVACYAQFVADAPPELTSSVVITNRPSPAVIVRGCWSGDLAVGRAFIDGWRELMPPTIDEWVEMPFADVAKIGDDAAGEQPTVTTGAWLDVLDAKVGAVLAGTVFAATGSVMAEVRHAGGAITGGDRANSTMGHRDCPFLLRIVGSGDALEPLRAAKVALDLPGSTYINFLEGDERRHGARTSLDADDLARIIALRRQLDPDDVFRFGVAHA